VRVHAEDADSGRAGQVVYGFPAHVQRMYGRVFRVDRDTGTIHLSTALDYETQTNYQLLVTATDLGTPPSLPTTARVVVKLLFLFV